MQRKSFGSMTCPIARDAVTQAEVNEVLVHHARRGRAR